MLWTKVTDEGRVRGGFVLGLEKASLFLEGTKATALRPTDNNTEIKLFEWRRNKDG
jgi:hypothetical protein